MMKYNFLEKKKTVCVITPTLGKDTLSKAIKSVEDQTYPEITHLVVIDGAEYWETVVKTISISFEKSKAVLTTAPFNTGGGGFYGHRIFAAYPHLVNHDYIAFLDDDNWWDETHVETLVELIERDNLDWAHSLRKVYVNGEYLAHDCCESIGREPIYFSKDDNPQHLVDTSSYMFKREFLIQVCQHWHSGWGGDRRFYHILKDILKHENYGTTGMHTLNYNLPDMQKAYGGDMKFFERGNEIVRIKHGGKYPWLK